MHKLTFSESDSEFDETEEEEIQCIRPRTNPSAASPECSTITHKCNLTKRKGPKITIYAAHIGCNRVDLFRILTTENLGALNLKKKRTLAE